MTAVFTALPPAIRIETAPAGRERRGVSSESVAMSMHCVEVYKEFCRVAIGKPVKGKIADGGEVIAAAGFWFAEPMPIGRGRAGVRHCVPNVSR